MTRESSHALLALAAISSSLALSVAATAQDIPRFEEVEIKTVSPDELNGGVRLEEPGKIFKYARTMPAEPSREELEATSEVVAARVVEIVAARTPPQPFEQVPTIHRGHAVWVSAREGGAAPILVSTLDWLEGAQEIYLVPAEVAAEERASTEASDDGQVALEQLEIGGDEQREAFERARQRYVRVKLVAGDRARNLAQLDPGEATTPPSKGLELMDLEREELSYLYGYAPARGELIQPTALLPGEPDDASIAFYFQTSFPAILGAPIITREGHLVVLNALLHPREPARALAIPPGALRHFIEARQKKGSP